MQKTTHYPLLALSALVFFCFTATAQQGNTLINSGELLKKGVTSYENGKYKDAIDAFKQVNRSDTNYIDALYELSMAYSADSQYNEALTSAKLGLQLSPKEFARFSMQVANTLDDIQKSEEAIEIYNKALEKNPQSHILHFNKGVTLYRLEKYEAAHQSFQQCLLINPYYSSAHYFVGNMYLQDGNIVAAMLAYKTYLMVAPNGKYLSKIINNLNAIAKVTDDVVKYMSNKKNTGENDFEFVQQIVASKVALDKQYKLQTELEDNIVRQIQVTDEKLEYNKGDKGFAMQFYAPLYQKLFQQGHFEAMVYNIFSGLEIEKIKKWNQKNKKATEAFADAAREYLNEIRSTRILNAADRKNATTTYLYENGKYIGRGALTTKGDKQALKGEWEFYYTEGFLKSKGSFNSEENKEGEWSFYYDDGKIKEKSGYKNGEQDGLAEGWFTNGNKWYTETHSNGQLNGMQTLYYYNGNIKQLIPYKDGKVSGVKKTWNFKGALTAAVNFVNDVQEGMAVYYYATGGKTEEVNYSNDKAQGNYKSYYENGKVSQEGIITDDKRQGLWTAYYENGAVKEKITYKDNEITGEFTEYHENGKLSRKGNYTRKKIDGKVEDYDDDGKIYSDAIYEKGKLKEINFYDKAGKQISSTGTRRGAATITFYSPEGLKTSEGYFNRDGNKDGKFTGYFLSGKVSSETNYKDGVEHGLSTAYYFNGQKKDESNYTDGVEEGNSKGYYFNGKLKYEGWFTGGERQQQFIFYNQLGDVTTKEYYLNGELDGYTEYYYPGNVRDFDYKYHNGWLEAIIQYDSTGKVLQENVFKQGNGPSIFKHYNGKILGEGTYKNYMLQGIYKVYYYDGSPKSVSYFKNDKRDSVFVDYFYGGVKRSEGRYKNGEKHGVWKYYFSNGKLLEEENYVDGKLQGENKIYNKDGTLDKVLNYVKDELDGMYKLYSGNNELILVLNYKDGMVKSYTYEDKSGALVTPIPLTGSNGTVKTLFKNGTPSATFTFVDNDIQGDMKLYFSSGKAYIDGKREFGYYNGVKKIYYATGQLHMEENYVLGNLHGLRKVYSATGKLEKEENYYNGDYHGVTKHYDETGKLKQTFVYYYDNLISVK